MRGSSVSAPPILMPMVIYCFKGLKCFFRQNCPSDFFPGAATPSRGRLCGLHAMRKNSFAPAEESVTVKHDDAGAFVAFHFNIGAGADDGPFIRAAGMGFAGFDYISDQNCFAFHYAIFQEVFRLLRIPGLPPIFR